MENPPTPVLELVDADITGAELRASMVTVKQVNWKVHSGDYWVVGGLPGSGKTDLLATAAGLQRPGTGDHFLFGRNLQRMGEQEQLRERLRAGFVFQGGGRLFHQQTILENLALPLCYHQNLPLEKVRDRVGEILKVTDLTGLEKRRPGILTRNIHERIGLARALMLDPEVLLIDNPLAGIDARQAYWWLDFLPRLAAGLPEFMHRRITLVVSTDDFRPWKGQGTHFALVHAKKWTIIGGGAELEASQDPAVREVLTPEFQRKES